MLKIHRKIALLLVVATSIMPIVPARALDTITISPQEGTLYNAIAYKDGKAYIDGDIYDDEAAYYQSNGDFKPLSNIDSGDDVHIFGEKYIDVNDGDYTINLDNGTVTDDDIVFKTYSTTALNLRNKVSLDTEDRYDQADTDTIKDDDELEIIPGAKYGPIWYSTTYRQATVGTANANADKFNVFTDITGNYIDADYNIGKIRVTTTSAGFGFGAEETVTVTNTNDTYDTAAFNDGLSVRVSQEKILTQDTNYIYRLVYITLSTNDGSAISKINGINLNNTYGNSIFHISNGQSTVEYQAIQKISKMASSDDIDGVHYANNVLTYALSNDDGEEISFQDLVNNYDTRFTAVDGKLIAYSVEDEDSVTVQACVFKSTNGYYYTDPEDQSREDCQFSDAKGAAVEVDVYGNLWRMDGGCIYKFNNTDDWDKVYRVDGSFDRFSVYDQQNIIAWNEDNEIYSLTNSPIKATEVKLNKATLSLLKGQTSTLTATVNPSNATNKAVTWNSTNTKVATVDANGKITAIAAGTTDITCTTNDGSKKIAICKVTVTNPIAVTSVKLNTGSLNLLKGKTSVLAATLDPITATNKTVTWSSSNVKAATVDATGKVTGVAAGTANITCTANDGSKKFAICKVTVTNPIIIKSIKLTSTLNVVKGQTSPLIAIFDPINPTNKTVTWSSSNTKIATVDANGKITGVAVGTANITCTTNDGSKKSAVCKVSVTNPVSITSLKLNKTSLSVAKGKASTLTATLNPINATNKTLVWRTGNEKIATVDANGKITGVGAGTTNVYCMTKDGNFNFAVCKVTVK